MLFISTKDRLNHDKESNTTDMKIPALKDSIGRECMDVSMSGA